MLMREHIIKSSQDCCLQSDILKSKIIGNLNFRAIEGEAAVLLTPQMIKAEFPQIDFSAEENKSKEGRYVFFPLKSHATAKPML